MASPESGPWWVLWSKVPMAYPNTQGCPGMWTNHVGGLFWCRFKLDLLNLLPSLILGLPTRPSTPFLELEVGSVPLSLNFRNLTLWNPQVGFTPWLGSASFPMQLGIGDMMWAYSDTHLARNSICRPVQNWEKENSFRKIPQFILLLVEWPIKHKLKNVSSCCSSSHQQQNPTAKFVGQGVFNNVVLAS
jgi:hypothetical protein